MKDIRKNLSMQRLMAAFSAVFALSGATVATAASYRATVLADNPVAYYRFEELPGTTIVADSSASGAYAGTYYLDDSGNFPELGMAGLDTNSVFFHVYPAGTGSPRAEIPYYPELNPAGPFSVEVWLRPTSVPSSGYRCPISSWGNGDAYAGWFIYQTSGANPVWVWIQRVGDIWIEAPGANKFEWSHLVASFDGTNTSFYVNGQYQAQAIATNAAPNSAQPLFIGCRDLADPGFNFDGDVDEVAIYTNGLSASQIQVHYQVGLTNIRVPLIKPTIITDPAATTAYAGHSVMFQAGVDGTPPLSYQWFRNGVRINDATDDSLIFTCAYSDNGTGYKVVVTNVYGSATSAPGVLTVSTDLLLAASPASTTRTVGSMAAFLVTPDGAMPFCFQWYKGSTPIAGATNQTLWLTKVQLADDASTYSAHVSNPYGGATNSEAATLSVVARTNIVPLTRYAQVVAANSPVAYWRLDQTDATSPAVDAVGSFDGATDNNAGQGTFTFGVPTGIPHETNTAMAVSGGATVQIPYALELNPYGPFSIEAWLKPATVAADGSGDYRTALGSIGNGVDGPSGWHLYQEPGGYWSLIIWAGSWSNTGWFTDFDDIIVANNWYHVVIVYDGTLFRLYVNGVGRFGLSWPYFVQNGDSPLVLGWGYSGQNAFEGVIDDVAVYNKALTAAQVEADYAATVRLTHTEAGNKSVLSWPFGTLQQSPAATGTYTNVVGATSPYTNTLNATTFFRVLAY